MLFFRSFAGVRHPIIWFGDFDVGSPCPTSVHPSACRPRSCRPVQRACYSYQHSERESPALRRLALALHHHPRDPVAQPGARLCPAARGDRRQGGVQHADLPQDRLCRPTRGTHRQSRGSRGSRSRPCRPTHFCSHCGGRSAVRPRPRRAHLRSSSLPTPIGPRCSCCGALCGKDCAGRGPSRGRPRPLQLWVLCE